MTVVSVSVLLALLFAADPAPHVAGGDEAPVCQYPATAAVLSAGTMFCSASLVHPRVVLFAAHCIGPGFGPTPDTIAFGEDARAPAREIAVESCGYHPDFEPQIEKSGVDVAFCTLSEPVEDVPIVPPLMGCERDVLVPGAPLTIVGFGSTYGVKIDGVWVEFSGAGPKRSGPQVLDQIVDDGIWMLGDDVSACPGDSGGPAMIQLEDGSWRIIGAASTNHPDAPQDGGDTCGYGSVYSNFASVMEWIENESGYDITPCHDADGTWNPSQACDAFPLAPDDASASSQDWSDGCATTQLSDLGRSCGPAFGEGGTTGSTGGGADDGEGSTGDDGAGSTAGGDDTDPTPTAGSTLTTAGAGTSGGSGTGGGEDGSAGEDGTAAGCGCANGRGTTPAAWMLGLFALLAAVNGRPRTSRAA